jgi:hypothetical protein
MNVEYFTRMFIVWLLAGIVRFEDRVVTTLKICEYIIQFSFELFKYGKCLKDK